LRRNWGDVKGFKGVYVAPTEPPALKAVATKITTEAEAYGVDVLFTGAEGRLCGVQRKEVKDLLASAQDGRLAKELGQMGSLDIKALFVEGQMTFTHDGMLMGKAWGREWTRAQVCGLLWGVANKGVWVHRTESLVETVEAVKLFTKWCRKAEHGSLDRRPSVGGGMWGSGPTHREFAVWMLQGIPGVGPKVAEAIYQVHGMPFKLTVGVEDLMMVEGIGKKKAEAIVGAFEG
jgi:ERCC4-type nuclease